jgi:hypothetical protein
LADICEVCWTWINSLYRYDDSFNKIYTEFLWNKRLYCDPIALIRPICIHAGFRMIAMSHMDQISPVRGFGSSDL